MSKQLRTNLFLGLVILSIVFISFLIYEHYDQSRPYIDSERTVLFSADSCSDFIKCVVKDSASFLYDDSTFYNEFTYYIPNKKIYISELTVERKQILDACIVIVDSIVIQKVYESYGDEVRAINIKKRVGNIIQLNPYEKYLLIQLVQRLLDKDLRMEQQAEILKEKARQETQKVLKNKLHDTFYPNCK